MAKEITLETLAQSSTPKKNSKTAEKPISESEQPVNGGTNVTPKSTGKGIKPISTSQLGKDQLNRHPDYAKAKAESEQVVNAPLIQSAFDSMERTIAERKEKIEKELVPVLNENAEKIAVEAMENGGVIPDDDVPDEIRENMREAGNLNNQSRRPESPQEIHARKEQQKANAMMQAEIDDEDDHLFDELDEDEPQKEEYIPKPTPDEVQYTNMKNNPVAARLAEQMQEKEEAENPEDTSVPKKEETVKEENKIVSIEEAKAAKESNVDTGENLDDLLKDLGINGEVDDSDLDDETPEEVRDRFKQNFSNVKIIKNPINLNDFKIRKAPTASSTILNAIEKKSQLKRADWALYYTGRSVTFEECKGPELDNLYKTIQASNSVNGVIASLQFVYNHIVDGNKPRFEQWTKMIRTEDIESLYFGMYRACYADSNLVPRTCIEKSCKKTSLIECSVDDMVKYDNDEAEKTFKELLNQDTTTHSKKIQSTLLQISDDIVISYSEPTLFKTFIQYASLKDEVVQKYSETLNTMAYIDDFFGIDRESGCLVPMEIKEYPNDLGKTVLSKLKVFISVLKSLNNDQFNALRGKLSNIIDDDMKVYYVYPEMQCPECKSTIPQAPIESCMNLLFTRAQLAQVQSS